MKPLLQTIILGCLPILASAEPSADTIYHGGPIITINDDQASAEAVAVKDGLILAVGAKDEVMRLVHEAQQNGTAVILATSEPELALAHADRILVMRRGEIVQQFQAQSVDKPALMRHAG